MPKKLSFTVFRQLFVIPMHILRFPVIFSGPIRQTHDSDFASSCEYILFELPAAVFVVAAMRRRLRDHVQKYWRSDTASHE